MRKKLFTLLLAVAASVGTMFAWDYEVQIGDLYYNLDATNQTAEVTYQFRLDENNYKGLTSANIPASVTYNSVTYSVTSIGNYAFRDCTSLTSVTIGNSVTEIGWYAFDGCSGLTSVTIPNSVTSIGGYAFRDCSGLTSIDVASDNSNYCSVDGVLFNKDKTTLIQYPRGKQGSYTIPNSVTSIGDKAFSGCTGLTAVTIPNSVTSIGDQAFYWCRGLTSVTIPNSVTSIGDRAFDWCDGLTFPVYNAHVFAFMPTTYSGAYTIPDGIESIAGSAFYGCFRLTSVTIPNSVTSIGEDAFSGCRGLTSVTIGNSVTCIGEGAFEDCSGLTSVAIPNSVTSIGKSAFSECTGLTSVTIPNSVTSIGSYAFYNCIRLTSVTIPNSVTSIGGAAFQYCSGLTSVTIGNSVTSIGDKAFRFCSGLTSVTCFATTPPQLDSHGVFNGVDKSIPLYVPAGSVSAYQSAYQWKDFTNILPIGAQPADVTTTTVTPSATTADIAWPQVTGAATYTIEIKKNGELICTLTFNAQGQLISIAFNAPSRNNAPQQAQAAGFSFTMTSLDSGTTYSYTMTAKGNNGNVLKTESGTFTTTGESQGFENVQGNNVQCTKIVRDGQIYILRGNKTYTLQGQEVK